MIDNKIDNVKGTVYLTDQSIDSSNEQERIITKKFNFGSKCECELHRSRQSQGKNSQDLKLSKIH